MLVNRFPIELQLMCLGIAARPEQRDLTPRELALTDEVAARLHRLSGWEVPPNPFHLGRIEAVDVGQLRPTETTPSIRSPYFSPDFAFYDGEFNDDREEGFVAAHALSSSLSLKGHLPWSDVFRWTLAAKLLVPTWLLDTHGVEWLAIEHTWAPEWLVRWIGMHRLAPAARA